MMLAQGEFQAVQKKAKDRHTKNVPKFISPYQTLGHSATSQQKELEKVSVFMRGTCTDGKEISAKRVHN